MHGVIWCFNMAKINKKLYTKHGFRRVKERTNIGSKEIKKELINIAIKKGLHYGAIPPGPLRDFLYSKAKVGNKRVKLYKGYIFIFFVNSKRLITCYPLPEQFQEEYKSLLK